MTKQDRAEMYRNFLAEEGYVPKIYHDGDVTFKFEGGTYIVQIDEKDEAFFHVLYPCFWSIKSESERARVTHAALNTTAQTKVAKVYPVQEDIWAAIEMFCSPSENFKGVFQRSLNALKAGVEHFRKQMHEPIYPGQIFTAFRG